MDIYSSLVSRVCKNEHLVNEAKRMAEFITVPPALNLVASQWEAVLENDVAFQDCQFRPEHKSFQSTAHYDYQTSKNPLFHVVLAGHCRFAKAYENNKVHQNPCVILSHVTPLTKIAQVMTRDLGPDIQISDEFKFSFKGCSLLGCSECRSSSAYFAKKGYGLKKIHQPCISITKIFDGQSIYNRFHSHLVEMFPGPFIALLHLQINSRYNYNDPTNPRQKLYRIGGIVTDMVAFNEAKLDFGKSVVLGDLSDVEALAEQSPPEEWFDSAKPASTVGGKTGNNSKNDGRKGTQWNQYLDHIFGAEVAPRAGKMPKGGDRDLFGSDDESLLPQRAEPEEEDLLGTEDELLDANIPDAGDDFFSIENNDCRVVKRPQVEEDVLSIDEPSTSALKKFRYEKK